MTQIVSTFEYCPLLQIVIIGVTGIRQSLRLVNAFVFCPRDGHLLHLFLLSHQPVHVLLDLWVRIRESHDDLALGAVEEVKGHSR